MTDIIRLPPEAQQSFARMQTLQQQMQNINMQKETLNFQKIESQGALEELEKLKDDAEIFKALGPILVKTKKADMIKELKDKMEIVDVRLESLDKQEEKIREKMEEAQKKLQELLKPADEEETAG